MEEPRCWEDLPAPLLEAVVACLGREDRDSARGACRATRAAARRATKAVLLGGDRGLPADRLAELAALAPAVQEVVIAEDFHKVHEVAEPLKALPADAWPRSIVRARLEGERGEHVLRGSAASQLARLCPKLETISTFTHALDGLQSASGALWDLTMFRDWWVSPGDADTAALACLTGLRRLLLADHDNPDPERPALCDSLHALPALTALALN
ncbi:MAG: hypothetical protein J3K34DRAFT_417138 [Monoraphidium minutum]|nr:MAG: hypothetical protein J3K34DRAFT_417138 [Monoraphidium minutum]